MRVILERRQVYNSACMIVMGDAPRPPRAFSRLVAPAPCAVDAQTEPVWEYARRTPMDQQDRFRGCFLGLAVGDAIGTTVEFRPRGSFAPLTDMVGGGPFHL